jgi:hypothetical protein
MPPVTPNSRGNSDLHHRVRPRCAHVLACDGAAEKPAVSMKTSHGPLPILHAGWGGTPETAIRGAGTRPGCARLSGEGWLMCRACPRTSHVRLVRFSRE